MPLRVRLIALVGAVLLVSLTCGSALVGWRAVHSVQTELRAALEVGVRTIRNGLEVHADPRHLVATFDGNRHVRAILLDAGDQLLAASEPLVPSQAAPHWFRRLIGGEGAAARLPVPHEAGATIVLRAEPLNEVSEVWGESRDAVLVLAGFAVLSALAVCVAVGRVLRLLERLVAAFERVGEGDYHGRVPERGPPEMARLAHGFNLMTGRLAAVAAQNRRLNERLLTIQAEERADVARDLHDEIGPLLFAVDMTAATIGRGGEIPTHVRSIHEAVGRMQRHVRALLERLRPLEAVGLEAAIDRLVAFWRCRRPEIGFTVTIAVEEDQVDGLTKETIYRVVQEAMSNAIRHGKPAHVEIAIAWTDAEGIRVAVTDDGGGMPSGGMAERGPGRFGLIGMRERVMELAGSLSIEPGRNGRGLTLVALLPRGRERDALE